MLTNGVCNVFLFGFSNIYKISIWFTFRLWRFLLASECIGVWNCMYREMVTKKGRSLKMFVNQTARDAHLLSGAIDFKFNFMIIQKCVSFDVNRLDSIFSKPHWNERKREEIKVLREANNWNWCWCLKCLVVNKVYGPALQVDVTFSDFKQWTRTLSVNSFANVPMFLMMDLNLLLNDILMMRLNDQIICRLDVVCNFSFCFETIKFFLFLCLTLSR